MIYVSEYKDFLPSHFFRILVLLAEAYKWTTLSLGVCSINIKFVSEKKPSKITIRPTVQDFMFKSEFSNLELQFSPK